MFAILYSQKSHLELEGCSIENRAPQHAIRAHPMDFQNQLLPLQYRQSLFLSRIVSTYLVIKVFLILCIVNYKICFHIGINDSTAESTIPFQPLVSRPTDGQPFEGHELGLLLIAGYSPVSLKISERG